jgi:hypothetical protein
MKTWPRFPPLSSHVSAPLGRRVRRAGVCGAADADATDAADAADADDADDADAEEALVGVTAPPPLGASWNI